MKKIACIILAHLFFAVSMNAQRLDSLLQQLSRHKKEDTARLSLLCAISSEYQNVSPSKGISAADTAILLAERLNNQNGLAKGYLTKGENYYRLNDYKNAFDWLQRSYDIYEKELNKTGISSCFNDMGNVKNALADYNGAIAYYEKAIDIEQQSNNNTGLAISYGNLANVYRNLSDYPKALQYLEKAIAINKNAGNSLSLASELNTEGTVYYNLSDYTSALSLYQQSLYVYERSNNKKGMAASNQAIANIQNILLNTDQALEYYRKALIINQQIGDTLGIAVNYMGIGGAYGEAKNYTEALEYYQKSLNIYNATGIKRMKAELLNNIGFANYSLGNYANVLKYYKEGLSIAEQLGQKNNRSVLLLSIGEFYRDAPDSVLMQNGLDPAHRFDTVAVYFNEGDKIAKDIGVLIWQRYAWEDLSVMYEKEKDFTKAFEAYKHFISLRDSMLNNEKEKKLSRLAMQYEFDKKKDSVELQKQVTDEKLQQQILLDKQQEQQIEIGKKELALTNQQKDLQNLAYLKTQADLKNEQLQKREKEKQLVISEKEKKLQQANAAKQQYSSRIRMYALIAVLAVFFLIAIILWRNNVQKQKANGLLIQQKQETDLQKTKAEQALDELRVTQRQLVQREKMASLGELTAGIAHEIQNPLNFVNNFSEVNTELIEEMEEEISKGNVTEIKLLAEDLKQNMEKISLHGKRADNIVKGMLQHSRTTSGIPELTDINALSDEYLRLSYHGLCAKDKSFNASINTDFDSSIQKINIVRQDMARVMLNLFNNAFYSVAEKSSLTDFASIDSVSPDYTPTVSVSTKKLDGKIEIKVRDNGMGIPEKVIDKIFQPFFTTKPTGQGTGLGLSLSYDIITKGNGGSLSINTKEGEYAEFIALLPVS